MPRFLPAALLVLSACLSAPLARAAGPADGGADELVQRGRYLVMIGGCNDCHTAGFPESGGRLPESQWLLGNRVGWSGAWGTTYAPNLRLRLAQMDLEAFTAYAHTLTTRPPMPWWALNAMSERDLAALHAFVTSLGPAGTPMPAALPPGATAPEPRVQFPSPPSDGLAADDRAERMGQQASPPRP
jgi:mono/diheme cytochrome c family protein